MGPAEPGNDPGCTFFSYTEVEPEATGASSWVFAPESLFDSLVRRWVHGHPSPRFRDRANHGCVDTRFVELLDCSFTAACLLRFLNSSPPMLRL